LPVLVVERDTMRLLAPPEVYSRGFVYMDESQDLIEAAKEVILRVVEGFHEDGGGGPEELYDRIKGAVAKHLYELTGRRPMVLPVIVPVGESAAEEDYRVVGGAEERTVSRLLELDDDLEIV